VLRQVVDCMVHIVGCICARCVLHAVVCVLHLTGTQGYARRAERVLSGTREVLKGHSRGTQGYSRGCSDSAALQGREADVVVISFVRARDGRAALADGGVGFLQVSVRPCLAITHEYPASTPGLRSARRTCAG
jgi:hypothetical protein